MGNIENVLTRNTLVGGSTALTLMITMNAKNSFVSSQLHTT